MGRWALVALTTLGLALGAAAAGAQEAPFVPSTDLLPPVAPGEPAPDASPVCGDDGLVCVRFVEEELAGWEERFGCDHRAVFPTVYRLLTREIRFQLEEDPSFFQDPAGLGLESLAFYELYEEMITAHLAGESIPRAWQKAIDLARSGDWTAGHDMLAGINAHVQRDMPFALARVGLVLPDGRSRKADHDRSNQILLRAYPTVVREVGRRYDPLMSDIEELPVVDDVGSQQLVAWWREGVWRNAESLTTTDGTALHDVVVQEIETNAHTWAQLIATGEVPGRREHREAHCAAFLADDQPAPADDDRDDPHATTADPATERAAPRPRQLPATGAGAALLGLGALCSVLMIRRSPRCTCSRQETCGKAPTGVSGPSDHWSRFTG